MTWLIHGGTIAKNQTVGYSYSWPAGVDPGPQHATARPAVHSCPLVVNGQYRMKIQDGSRIRWEYGFTLTNAGWADTYFEVEGGNHA